MSNFSMSYVFRDVSMANAAELDRLMQLNIGEIRTGVRKAFYFMGKDIVQIARKGITDPPKTGRIYQTRVGNGLKKLQRLGNHQASAPGEYPANWTGVLRSEVGFNVDAVQLSVGDSADYAAYVELGTSKMAARPYLLPSIDKNQRSSEQHLIREITKVVCKCT